MTIKHNNATINRPGGERIIDAPAVVVDIPTYIRLIKSEEAWQKNDRNSITVFKSDDMRIVVGGLHTGAQMIHKSEGLMSVQVLEGVLDVITDDTSATLEKGQVIAIHKDCNYRMLASEEVIYILTMTNVS
jgi:hypothetical protein